MRASHRIWVAATRASSINCTSSLSNTHPWKQIITTQQPGLSLELGRERRKTQWIMLWNHVLVPALIVIAPQLSKGKWKKITAITSGRRMRSISRNSRARLQGRARCCSSDSKWAPCTKSYVLGYVGNASHLVQNQMQFFGTSRFGCHGCARI